MALSEAQVERYARQIVMPEFNPTVQERLLKSHVLIHGSVGPAPLALLYLAGSGVGFLHLSSRERQMERAMKHAALLNPGSSVTFGSHGISPSAAADFSQDVGPHSVRRISGALASDFPYILALTARDTVILKSFAWGDACPGCILNAVGLGVTDLLPDTGNCAAGPAAAAMLLAELAGYADENRRTRLMDISAGRFNELNVLPVPDCILCAMLARPAA